MTTNSDFSRFADQVVVPSNAKFGWTTGEDERDALDLEKRAFGALNEDFPAAFRMRESITPVPERLASWEQFQKDKGRYAGSADWIILDEWVFGKEIVWLPQIIGSCVCSNTFRAYVLRMMYEIALLGQGEEYLGLNEFGPKNLAFYCPVTYGLMRKRGGLTGRGDGGFCAPMAESLLKDGVLRCDNPKLMQALGQTQDRNFPEPQSEALYRKIGDGYLLNELKPELSNHVLEAPQVKTGDQLWDLLQAGKPAFVCSMEAIRKVGMHPDGFAIHERDPSNQWAHNMAFHGARVASDGERFFSQSNESWGRGNVYSRRFAEVDKRLRSGQLECVAIGEISGNKSKLAA